MDVLKQLSWGFEQLLVAFDLLSNRLLKISISWIPLVLLPTFFGSATSQNLLWWERSSVQKCCNFLMNRALTMGSTGQHQPSVKDQKEPFVQEINLHTLLPYWRRKARIIFKLEGVHNPPKKHISWMLDAAISFTAEDIVFCRCTWWLR